MKTAFTLAVLGALAATPALAQGMEQGGGGMGGPTGAQPSQHSSQMEQQQQGRMGQHHAASNTQTVRNVQQALVDQGYQVGAIDGKMGPRTRQALRDFQQKEGMNGSGRLDQQTLAALGVETGTQQAQTPEERTQRPMGSQNAPGAEEQHQQQVPPSGAMPAPQGGSMGR